jgi:hypothetical protein
VLSLNQAAMSDNNTSSSVTPSSPPHVPIDLSLIPNFEVEAICWGKECRQVCVEDKKHPDREGKNVSGTMRKFQAVGFTQSKRYKDGPHKGEVHPTVVVKGVCPVCKKQITKMVSPKVIQEQIELAKAKASKEQEAESVSV